MPVLEEYSCFLTTLSALYGMFINIWLYKHIKILFLVECSLHMVRMTGTDKTLTRDRPVTHKMIRSTRHIQDRKSSHRVVTGREFQCSKPRKSKSSHFDHFRLIGKCSLTRGLQMCFQDWSVLSLAGRCSGISLLYLCFITV